MSVILDPLHVVPDYENMLKFNDNSMNNYEFKLATDGQTGDNAMFNKKNKYYGSLPTGTWIDTFTPDIGDAINFSNVQSNSGLSTYEPEGYTERKKLNKSIGKTNIKKLKAKERKAKRQPADDEFAWLDEEPAPRVPRAPIAPRAPRVSKSARSQTNRGMPKAKARSQPKETFNVSWISALKTWNGQKGGAWCLPRKGSSAYEEVLDIRRNN